MTDLIKIDNQHKTYSKNEKQRVHAFVASVFQLYPAYGGDLLKDDNFKAQCRIHAAEIVKFQPQNYDDRLNKIKQLVAVQNMPGLYGNYKNSVQALSSAAGAMDKLNHDYHLAYPVQSSSGALDRIKKAITEQSDTETALKNIQEIQNILKDDK